MNKKYRYRVYRFTSLIAVLGVLFLAAAAEAQQGGRVKGGGGARRGGGGRERPLQQKPGKPAEERFLRVCRVLSFSEDQLEKAMKIHQGMKADREKILAGQQSGAYSSAEAETELKKLDKRFGADFRAMLDEEQGKKLAELREDGTLGDEWW